PHHRAHAADVIDVAVRTQESDEAQLVVSNAVEQRGGVGRRVDEDALTARPRGRHDPCVGLRQPQRKTFDHHAQLEYSIRPLSITTSPRWVSVRNRAESPSTHIDTVSVSPGYTGLEKRASIDLNRAGSESHSACSSARPVKP